MAMGRFGEVLLVNGETDLSLDAQLGEVVRLYLTNTANTRTFKVALPGARMKLVGGDSGHVEHEEFVEDVVLAPSERVVVDVLFERAWRPDAGAPHAGAHLPAGRHPRERRPDRAFVRGAVRGPPHERRHGRRARADRSLLDAEPDKTLGSSRRWTWRRRRGPVVYACRCTPRWSGRAGQLPEVRDEAVGGRGAERRLRVPDASGGREREPGHCPECQMKLVPAALSAKAGTATSTRGTTTKGTTTTTPLPAASSGKTTWSRSIGSPRPRTCAGSSSIAIRATRTRRSTGASGSATR